MRLHYIQHNPFEDRQISPSGRKIPAMMSLGLKYLRARGSPKKLILICCWF